MSHSFIRPQDIHYYDIGICVLSACTKLRFDYVSELDHDVEKLQESIQVIKGNMKTMRAEDGKKELTTEDSIRELKVTQYCSSLCLFNTPSVKVVLRT